MIPASNFTHFEIFLEEPLVLHQLVIALHARRTDLAQLSLENRRAVFIFDPIPLEVDTYLLAVPPSLQLGYENLLTVVDGLLSDHDDSQLLSQFDQAPSVGALQAGLCQYGMG